MITKLGLKAANKTTGSDPSGVKTFLVGSDTKISDDIDTILDASYAGSEIPAYNDLWSVDTTINLRVDSKRAEAYDMKAGTQEGFWWVVSVNYEVPESSDNQNEEDPTKRAWQWSKSSEEGERAIINSLFDTSGYIYPGTVIEQMVNRGAGDSISNTAGEPPENGIAGPQSMTLITLTKYVNSVTDLGVASWYELDQFVDKINSNDPMRILGINYENWELLMKGISYRPVSINGYDVIEVSFKILADLFKSHVFSYPSAGYNELLTGDDELSRVKSTKTGEDANTPRLLDADGLSIPIVGDPLAVDPFLISIGRHELADWSSLTLPDEIP